MQCTAPFPQAVGVASELGVVVALLAADPHLRHAENDVAVGVRHRAQPDDPEHGDLPGEDRSSLRRRATRRRPRGPRPAAPSPPASPTSAPRGARREGEGRPVRVVDGHGEEQSHAEPRREPNEACGDEAGGRVAHAEHRQEQGGEGGG
jgi:hypothetical protein